MSTLLTYLLVAGGIFGAIDAFVITGRLVRGYAGGWPVLAEIFACALLVTAALGATGVI